ncbi:MAG: AAA family ATPase [Armatimonadetes bacterium]|nr:AAA family ATPase [Armatimonadota bacterium]
MGGDVGPAPDWHLTLFGPLTCRCRNGPPVKFRTRKTAALVAYLALFSDRKHDRSDVAATLWGETEDASVMQSLRTALTSVRQATDVPDSEKFVMNDREFVWFDSDRATTDVGEFDRLRKLAKTARDDVKESALEQAVALVKAPLLAGSDETWVYPQWIRLEEAYAQTVVDLMRVRFEQSRAQDAVLVGRSAVALLGAREDVHIELIRAYGLCGQPSLALAQFESLERLLDEQWGEAPSEAAQAALEAVPKAVPGAVKSKRPQTGVVPGSRSRLFGREGDLEDIGRLLDPVHGPRLMTLHGPGGCGKTSLAAEFARHWSGEGRPAWFVSLSTVEDAANVWTTVARALDLPVIGASAKSVGKALDSDGGLLVLDNVEQLGEAGGLQVGHLLDATAGLRVLVTSRHLLRIAGEQAFPVRPLPVPQRGSKLAELHSSASVQLFVDRCRLVRRDFELTTATAAAVEQLCRMLDGLPLAIELAASKTGTMSVAEVAAEFGRSPRSLVAREADREDRHRCLEAALEWSLKGLEDHVRRAFYDLSSLRGPFPMEAGRAVIGLEDADRAVSTLVECSLVETSRDIDDRTWIRLLEPVRQFGRSKLEDSGRYEETAARTFVHYETLAKSGTGDLASLSDWSKEAANLIGAVEAGLAGGVDADRVCRYALGLEFFCRTKGFSSEWRHAIGKLWGWARGKVDDATFGILTLEHGRANGNVMPVEDLLVVYSEAQDLLSRTDQRTHLARCWKGLAATNKAMGRYDVAHGFYELAVAHYESDPDPKSLADCYRDWAMNANSVKDYRSAAERLEKAVAAARTVDDPETLAWCLTDLGTEQAINGNPKASDECFQEAFGLCDLLDNPKLASIVHWQHGESQYRTGAFEKALGSHQKCLASASKAGFTEGTKWFFLTLGCCLVKLGLYPEAARCWGKMHAMRTSEGRAYTGDELELYEPADRECSARLGPAGNERHRSDGAACSLESLIREMMAVGPSTDDPSSI